MDRVWLVSEFIILLLLQQDIMLQKLQIIFQKGDECWSNIH